MRMSLLGSHVTVLSCAAALMTANAWAQDAAAPPPPTPATEPAPVTAPAPVAAPVAPPAQVQPDTAAQGTAPTAPAAEPAAAAPTGPAGWFRIDSDLTNVQLWAGATHPLGDGIGLASDIYITTGLSSLGEFDLGPAITAGPFTITPMLGYQIDWANRRSNSIVPQLYVTGGPDPIYMEFWFQNYENQIFKDGAANDIYTRLFVNYKLSPFISIGPEIEPWFALNKAGDTRKTGISSFVVGADVMFFSYGTNNTLQLFLGYETKEKAQVGIDGGTDRKLGGRFSFVHNW